MTRVSVPELLVALREAADESTVPCLSVRDLKQAMQASDPVRIASATKVVMSDLAEFLIDQDIPSLLSMQAALKSLCLEIEESPLLVRLTTLRDLVDIAVPQMLREDMVLRQHEAIERAGYLPVFQFLVAAGNLTADYSAGQCEIDPGEFRWIVSALEEAGMVETRGPPEARTCSLTKLGERILAAFPVH